MRYGSAHSELFLATRDCKGTGRDAIAAEIQRFFNYRSNRMRGITVDGGRGASLHSPQGVV